jgi:hypothetical protein
MKQHNIGRVISRIQSSAAEVRKNFALTPLFYYIHIDMAQKKSLKQLPKSARYRRLLRGTSGNALPVVLMFASVGLIVVVGYLSHQARSNARALRSPTALQATFNARSGVYHALDNLIWGNEPNTPEASSEIEQLFSMDMFDGADTSFGNESPDTSVTKRIFLYADDSVNTADINVEPQGIYCLITSVSTVLHTTRTVQARLGSPAPAKPDTVLILENNLPIRGRLSGRAHQTDKKSDTLSSTKSVEGRIKEFIISLNSKSMSTEDTSFFEAPLVIRNSGELGAIPDDVKSHLLLDGSFSSITWKSKRKITVSGDLQVTGFFKLENLEFSVGGEIRILDYASLANVTLFTEQRIFIGDNAVFHGNALAMGTINVFGHAEVKERSSLVAAGVRSSMSQNRNQPNRYSIFFSDAAKFDGTAVALGNPGGIKTDPKASLQGILWAQRAVCHGGKLTGIIKAEFLLDCYDPESDSLAATPNIAENVFSGTIEPLLSIGDYVMPYFIGTPRIISWREF